MKKYENGNNILFVAACLLWLLYSYYMRTLILTPVTESQLANLADEVLKISIMHEMLQKKIDQERLRYEVPGAGIDKFFHEHFETAFNVLYLEENDFDFDELREELDEHDPFESEYYLDDPEYYDNRIELYAGYKSSVPRNRRMYVKWVHPKVGYGVFANMNLKKGTYLGDYTGMVIVNSPNYQYSWNHPYKHLDEDGKEDNLGIDARYAGNMMRFVNAHLDEDVINTRVVFFLRDNHWIVGYYTVKPIKKGEQIVVSYGKSYWNSRPLFNPVNPESEPSNKENLE